MLEAAIGLIAAQLNQALRSAFQLSEGLVVVTSLVDVNGGAPVNATNKLVIFLANIERETVVAVQACAQPFQAATETPSRRPPPQCT